MLSQTAFMRSIAVMVSCLAVLSVIVAPAALAWREPTVGELEQITNWYPAYIRNAPVECVHIVIHVSSRDRRYALTYPQVLNWRRPHSRCLRYAGNGFEILRKQRGKWRSVFSGSVGPPCSLKIPRDLTQCRKSR